MRRLHLPQLVQQLRHLYYSWYAAIHDHLHLPPQQNHPPPTAPSTIMSLVREKAVSFFESRRRNSLERPQTAPTGDDLAATTSFQNNPWHSNVDLAALATTNWERALPAGGPPALPRELPRNPRPVVDEAAERAWLDALLPKQIRVSSPGVLVQGQLPIPRGLTADVLAGDYYIAGPALVSGKCAVAPAGSPPTQQERCAVAPAGSPPTQQERAPGRRTASLQYLAPNNDALGGEDSNHASGASMGPWTSGEDWRHEQELRRQAQHRFEPAVKPLMSALVNINKYQKRSNSTRKPRINGYLEWKKKFDLANFPLGSPAKQFAQFTAENRHRTPGVKTDGLRQRMDSCSSPSAENSTESATGATAISGSGSRAVRALAVQPRPKVKACSESAGALKAAPRRGGGQTFSKPPSPAESVPSSALTASTAASSNSSPVEPAPLSDYGVPEERKHFIHSAELVDRVTYKTWGALLRTSCDEGGSRRIATELVHEDVGSC